MKKIILLIITLFSFNTVKAFSIDVDKIEIDARSTTLISKLDSTYEINSPKEMASGVTEDDKAKDIAKELLSITISTKLNNTEKRKEFLNYQFIDSTNGGNTLAVSLFLDDYFNKLDKNKMSFSTIQTIRTVSFKEGEVLAFAYIKDAEVNNETKDVVFAFWFKIVDGEYKLNLPWFKIDDDLENYFNEVSLKEDNGNIIGGASNKISLTNNKKTVDDNLLKKIYDENVSSSVQITGMNLTGSNLYGSGFFIREGVIVTTWSLFLQFLTDSNYIFVNDFEGNVYTIKGIISAEISYDIVVLKLEQEVGKKVTFTSVDNLELDDNLFTINSKLNSGFSISYGTFVKSENGILQNLFALSSSDIGSALYNEEGKVVAFNVGDVLNSDLSYAHSTDYLIKLQDNLTSKSFDLIQSTSLDTFKTIYYHNYEEEKTYNNIPDKIWNKYKTIGDLENKITLNLIKASYVDDILSLRYKNQTLNTIDSFYLISSYIEELEKEGFKLTSESPTKKIYKNNKYEIIIREDLNYLVILIMEI